MQWIDECLWVDNYFKTKSYKQIKTSIIKNFKFKISQKFKQILWYRIKYMSSFLFTLLTN